jgi:limonene-1,2-epoxide hydrolase
VSDSGVTPAPEERPAYITMRRVVDVIITGSEPLRVRLQLADRIFGALDQQTELVTTLERCVYGRIGFEVYVHAISADGGTVLTERTDVLKFGRLRVQFWVCGRFDVHDGQIVLWRDYYFDQMNIAAATIRGLLGTVFPAVRAKPPSTA